MAAQVASPSSAAGADGGSPSPKVGSRRSILASMTNGLATATSRPGTANNDDDVDGARDEAAPAAPASPQAVADELDDAPLGRTDSVLRSRRASTPSKGGSSLRRKSVTQRGATPVDGERDGASSANPPVVVAAAPAIAPAVAQTFPTSPTSPAITGNANGNVNGNLSADFAATANGTANTSIGSRLRRRLSNLSQQSGNNTKDDQSDRASIHSNFSSHREAISSFIRRSRSRSASQEPPETASVNGGGDANGSATAASGMRRRTSSAARRMSSLKLPGKLGRSRRDSTHGDDTPPVPAIPADKRSSVASSSGGASRSSAGNKTSSAAAPQGYPGAAADSSAKSVASSQSSGASAGAAKNKTSRAVNGKPAGGDVEGDAKKDADDADDANGSNGYLAAVTTAVAGTAAAVVAKVTGQDDGYNSESDDDSDDVFHDAELANISEGEEEEDGKTNSGEPAAAALPAADKSRSAYHTAGRSRGVSEASGTDSARASSGALDLRKTQSPDETTEQSSTAAARTPSKLKGTSGAKRRAGSTPIGGGDDDDGTGASSTPQDAKAKKELPAEVREKAARVQQLTFDDVQQSAGEMEKDIEVARGALHLFLNSRMIEAEEIIKEHADRRMYYALGYGLIATMKGFMTFESEDLAVAISYCKDAMHIAHLLRKPSNSVANFGRFVRGTGHSPSAMSGMSIVQRHAELVYAESMLLKAVLGIVYSGDFFGFVAEALNMRNAYGIYRSLGKYIEHADGKVPNRHDKGIDQDFRSGAMLGNGLISLILGLLPSKVLKIMDVFGYSGDTKEGLSTLMKAGGWSSESEKAKSKMSQESEGIRRPVCDMGILLFHLVISVFIPVTGVNIGFADRVLHYHLQRYPQGVFFLYFSGRLYSTQAMCERAIKQYKAAREAQQEYVQLQHISWWDASLCHMSLCQWSEAERCFDVLLRESNWSKCVYTYGVAANRFQGNSKGSSEEAAALFAKVPGLMQRIAGKSIPMEKFVARKAHKFNTQGRLLLPALEFSYIYHCLSNAPRYALLDEQLVMVSDALSELNEVKDPATYHSGADEYWDDFCLAHFLRGVTLRYIAHPEPHAKVDPPESDIPEDEANEQAMLSFKAVLEHGHKIATDHYIIYFSHYELGRLHGNMGDRDDAKRELELVLSGKMLEDKGRRKGNHKYGMQNMALLRSNGALNALDLGGS